MNIFKTLALAMLMPAMVLTTACSNDDDLVNNENTATKGYSLPVTINVTRQGDEPATRASYNESTRKLEFSEGDKLFVSGQDNNTVGTFKGVLTWVSGGTFSGSINTQNEYTGTADALLTDAPYVTATLLPAGYESYAFLSIEDETDCYGWVSMDLSKAFAPTKKAAVEQFSYEYVSKYSSGFALAPQNAILSFTISGLAANTEVAVLFKDAYDTGATPVNVTTDASGVATFAVAVYNNDNIDYYTLTVDGIDITLPAKKAEKGHIYKISSNPYLLSGVFSVSSTKKVKFSKGNLRYASGTWSFFDNQYDYYTSYSADARDKFGWSTSATTYGMNTSTSSSTYSGDFVDWGATMGTGWFTLSSAEWAYLFETRSASTVGGTADGHYAKAKVNGVQGVILFPDTYTHPDGVTAPKGVNATDNTGWNGNSYTVEDWTKMESAGCVFLPAAGYRTSSSVSFDGTIGFYWSATSYGSNNAYDVNFNSGDLNPANENTTRYYGFSVRLVRQVE